jgi:serine protease
MFKRCLGVAAVVIAFFGLASTGRSTDADLRAMRLSSRSGPDYVPGRVIVAFASTSEQSVAERAIRSVGGRSAWRSPHGGHYVVTLDGDVSVMDAVTAFRGMRDVEYAEPDYIAHAHFRPNDPFFSEQWNMLLLNAERTWDIQRGDTSVIVAVLDTGIAFEDFDVYRKAPDWGNTRFVPGFDFINRDSHPNDDDGHGTHVSSTIAEATDNATGVAGLAFGCSLMPVKVLDSQGNGPFSAIAEGLDFAVANGAKIVNMSLGGEFESQTARLAVNRAVAAGVTVIASSGNEERSSVSFPAAFPNVIAVGALDPARQRAPYSNFGTALDVVAPGGNLVDNRGGRLDVDRDGLPDGVLQQTLDFRLAPPARFQRFIYAYFQGTSMAAPHVSATAALLYTQGIREPAAIQAAIESTAQDLGPPGRDDQYGFGMVRPVEALRGLGLNK